MGHVLVRVAQATGRGVLAVCVDPYAVTLWTYLRLMDADRIDVTRRLGERIDLASKVAMAFHEPSKLHQVDVEYREQVGALPSMRDTADRGRSLVAAIATGKVLE